MVAKHSANHSYFQTSAFTKHGMYRVTKAFTTLTSVMNTMLYIPQFDIFIKDVAKMTTEGLRVTNLWKKMV